MDQVIPRRRANIVWVLVVFVVVLCLTAASGDTVRGRIVLAGVQRFLLFYSGVFALIALTAAVGVGLAAADRIVMMPSGRVVAQGVHRAVSLAALAFLFIHIVTEILAHRADVVDAFVPFLARGRTFYVGLGTIASDLVVILVVTGIARGRFATRRPWTWRAIHATAYLCWLLSLVHGLVAGRTAKPYVDWSYGACVAAVALALLFRAVASVRDRRETAAHPVPDRASGPVTGPMPAAAQMGFVSGLTAVSQASRMPRALPAGPADRHAARSSQGAAGQHRTGEQPVINHRTGEHRTREHRAVPQQTGPLPTVAQHTGSQHTGPQRAVQDPVIQGAVVQEPAVPQHPGYPAHPQAYSQPLQPMAPYAADPYADPSYAGVPYPDDVYEDPSYAGATQYDAYGDPSYGGVAYPDGTYEDPAYAETFYPDGSYADLDYGDRSYGDNGYVDLPYPDDPYADAAYGAEGAYPGDPYGAVPYPQPPGPGLNLWPDHPSWPRNGIVSDPSAFGHGPGAERS